MILIAQTDSHGKRQAQSAFTLVEVVMAAGLAGIMFTTAMMGFSNSFSMLQLDRENSRATQILLEKTEMLRVYNWDQITGKDATTYIPTTFTAPFYPGTNNANGGFSYSGTVVITNLVTTASYSNDLRTVTVTLTWTSGKASRSRTMTTYVSAYGLQNTLY